MTNHFHSERVIANNYTTRVEEHQGEKHIIVPVIMMVEGVHNGSCGPLFHPAEELGKNIDSWNGIPVSIAHPEEAGEYISANQPGVVDDQVVGRVYATTFTDDGKLRAEAWLDQERLRTIAPEALIRIQNGRPIEVSVGVFSDEEMTPGEWNGEVYEAIARNHRPDHLALLLDAVGACSWEDGCGVRANEEGGESGLNLKANKQGYRELMGLIQNKLDGMDNSAKIHFLTEVYNSEIVYEVQPITEGGGEATFYRQSYTKSANEITFTGQPVEVVRKVDYAVLTESNSEGGETKMAKERKCKGCPEKVALIIANEATQWTEADTETLLNLGEDLGEEFLDKLIPEEVEEPDAPEVIAADGTPAANEEEDKGVYITQEQLADKTEFMKLLAPEVRAQYERGMQTYEAEKQRLIAHITEHSKDVWTAAELATKDVVELEKLAAMVKAPVDYSVQAGGSGLSNEIKPMFPTGFKEEGAD